MFRPILFLVLLITMLAIGCGETPPESKFGVTSASTGTGETYKLKPPTNGDYISEMEACQKLLAAFTNQKSQICGQATAPTCPQFLRGQYDPDCMFYDAGTVQGCVDYYKGLKLCADFVATDCFVTGYPETAPAGCD